MKDNEFDTAFKNLMSTLTELIDLLRHHKEERWSSILDDVRDGIGKGSKSGLDSLAQMCQAGSESLHEVYVQPNPGDNISSTEVDEANRKIGGLVTTLDKLTRALRCNL